MENQIKEFLNLVIVGNIHIQFEPDYKNEIYKGSSYKQIEARTISLFNNNDSIRISYAYISGINFDKLEKDIIAADKKLLEIWPSHGLSTSDTELANTLSKLSNERNKLKMIKKDLQSKQYPYGLVGTLVSTDLTLVYRDKAITGGIYLPDGNRAFISAKIDEYGNIGMLNVNVFNDGFDKFVTEYCDKTGKCSVISYSIIDEQMDFLKGLGINPSLSIQIDFNQILKEGHHSDLKNYMVLIHTFRDIIIGKIIDAMQSEKVKIKSSGK